MQVYVYHINNVSVVRHFSLITYDYIKNSNEIHVYTLSNLQNNTDVISRYGCNGNAHVNHIDPMHVHKFTRLFIDRIDINLMDIYFLHLYINQAVAELYMTVDLYA